MARDVTWRDIGANPRKKKLEANAENAVVKWAREQGWLVRKMNGLGAADWPDRMFITCTGKVLFIEFKRKGEYPTEKQNIMLSNLQKRGVAATWADDAEGAKFWLMQREVGYP